MDHCGHSEVGDNDCMLSLFPIGIDHYIVGGVFVGLGIAIPYILTGIVASVSTTYPSLWSYVHKGWFFQKPHYLKTRRWHIALVAGLMTGGLVYMVLVPDVAPTTTDVGFVRLFLGGVLIAIGARMSHGCTSGHGICGNAALEKVSFIATGVFLTVAIIVAHIMSLFLNV